LRIRNLLQTRLLQRQAREIQAHLDTLAAPGTDPQAKPERKS